MANFDKWFDGTGEKPASAPQDPRLRYRYNSWFKDFDEEPAGVKKDEKDSSDFWDTAIDVANSALGKFNANTPQAYLKTLLDSAAFETAEDVFGVKIPQATKEAFINRQTAENLAQMLTGFEQPLALTLKGVGEMAKGAADNIDARNNPNGDNPYTNGKAMRALGDLLMNGGEYFAERAESPERQQAFHQKQKDYGTPADMIANGTLGEYLTDPGGFGQDLTLGFGNAAYFMTLAKMFPTITAGGRLPQGVSSALGDRIAGTTSGLLRRAGLNKAAQVVGSNGARDLLSSGIEFAPTMGLGQAITNAGSIVDTLRQQGYSDAEIYERMKGLIADELPADMAFAALTGNVLKGNLGRAIAGRNASTPKLAAAQLPGLGLESAGGFYSNLYQMMLSNEYSGQPHGEIFGEHMPNEAEAGNLGLLLGAIFGAGGMPNAIQGAREADARYNRATEQTNLEKALYGKFREDTQEHLDKYGEAGRQSYRDAVSEANLRELARSEAVPDNVFDIIMRVADEEGVPRERLLAQAIAESNGDQSVISPVGAIGVMQLMPETAEALGVDPDNIEQNIRGGALYLKQQYEQFGDWSLAHAAYNAGPNAVKRYGGIPPYAETQKYVDRINGLAGNIPSSEGNAQRDDGYYGEDGAGEGNTWFRQGDASLEGAQPQLLNAIDMLADWLYKKTGRRLVVTSGTNGDHPSNGSEHGHSSGWKVDVVDEYNDGEDSDLITADFQKGKFADEFIAYGRSLGLGMNFEDAGTSNVHFDIALDGTQWDGNGEDAGGFNPRNGRSVQSRADEIYANKKRGLDANAPSWSDYVKAASKTNESTPEPEPEKPRQISLDDAIFSDFANDRLTKAVEDKDVDTIQLFSGMFEDDGTFADTRKNRAMIQRRYGDELAQFAETHTSPAATTQEQPAQTQQSKPQPKQTQQPATPAASNKANKFLRNDPVIQAGHKFIEELGKSGKAEDFGKSIEVYAAIQQGDVGTIKNILKQNGRENLIQQAQQESQSQSQEDPVKQNTTPENKLEQQSQETAKPAKQKTTKLERAANAAARPIKTGQSGKETRIRQGNAMVFVADENGVEIPFEDRKALLRGNAKKLHEWQLELSSQKLIPAPKRAADTQPAKPAEQQPSQQPQPTQEPQQQPSLIERARAIVKEATDAARQNWETYRDRYKGQYEQRRAEEREQRKSELAEEENEVKERQGNKRDEDWLAETEDEDMEWVIAERERLDKARKDEEDAKRQAQKERDERADAQNKANFEKERPALQQAMYWLYDNGNEQAARELDDAISEGSLYKAHVIIERNKVPVSVMDLSSKRKTQETPKQQETESDFDSLVTRARQTQNVLMNDGDIKGAQEIDDAIQNRDVEKLRNLPTTREGWQRQKQQEAQAREEAEAKSQRESERLANALAEPSTNKHARKQQGGYIVRMVDSPEFQEQYGTIELSDNLRRMAQDGQVKAINEVQKRIRELTSTSESGESKNNGTPQKKRNILPKTPEEKAALVRQGRALIERLESPEIKYANANLGNIDALKRALATGNEKAINTAQELLNEIESTRQSEENSRRTQRERDERLEREVERDAESARLESRIDDAEALDDLFVGKEDPLKTQEQIEREQRERRQKNAIKQSARGQEDENLFEDETDDTKNEQQEHSRKEEQAAFEDELDLESEMLDSRIDEREAVENLFEESKELNSAREDEQDFDNEMFDSRFERAEREADEELLAGRRQERAKKKRKEKEYARLMREEREREERERRLEDEEQRDADDALVEKKIDDAEDLDELFGEEKPQEEEKPKQETPTPKQEKLTPQEFSEELAQIEKGVADEKFDPRSSLHAITHFASVLKKHIADDSLLGKYPKVMADVFDQIDSKLLDAIAKNKSGTGDFNKGDSKALIDNVRQFRKWCEDSFEQVHRASGDEALLKKREYELPTRKVSSRDEKVSADDLFTGEESATSQDVQKLAHRLKRLLDDRLHLEKRFPNGRKRLFGTIDKTAERVGDDIQRFKTFCRELIEDANNGQLEAHLQEDEPQGRRNNSWRTPLGGKKDPQAGAKAKERAEKLKTDIATLLSKKNTSLDKYPLFKADLFETIDKAAEIAGKSGHLQPFAKWCSNTFNSLQELAQKKNPKTARTPYGQKTPLEKWLEHKEDSLAKQKHKEDVAPKETTEAKQDEATEKTPTEESKPAKEDNAEDAESGQTQEEVTQKKPRAKKKKSPPTVSDVPLFTKEEETELGERAQPFNDLWSKWLSLHGETYASKETNQLEQIARDVRSIVTWWQSGVLSSQEEALQVISDLLNDPENWAATFGYNRYNAYQELAEGSSYLGLDFSIPSDVSIGDTIAGKAENGRRTTTVDITVPKSIEALSSLKKLIGFFVNPNFVDAKIKAIRNGYRVSFENKLDDRGSTYNANEAKDAANKFIEGVKFAAKTSKKEVVQPKAEEKPKAKEAAAKYNENKASTEGGADTRITNLVDDSKLTPQQKLLKDFAAKLGVPIQFFDNPDGRFHGVFSDGVTFLNVNSKKGLGGVFWHESFHWLKANNPKLYAKLVEAAGITDAQRKAFLERTGRKDLTTNEAIDEEILADQMEDVAKRTGLLQNIAGKNRGVVERVVQWLKDTMNKFIETFRNPQGRLTTAQAKALAGEFGKIAHNLKDANGNQIFRVNNRTGNIEVIGGRTAPQTSAAKATAATQSPTVKYSIDPADNSNESWGRRITNFAKAIFGNKPPTKPHQQIITDALSKLARHKIYYGYNGKNDGDVVVDSHQKAIFARHGYDFEKLLPVVGKQIAANLKLPDTPEMSNYIAKWMATGALNDTSQEAKAFAKAMRDNPAEAELLQSVRDSFKALANMTPYEKFRNSIVRGGKKQSDSGGFMENFVDDLYPIKKLEDMLVDKAEDPKIAKLIRDNLAPYLNSRLFKGKGAISDMMIGERGHKYTAEDIQALRDVLQSQYPNVDFSNFTPLAAIIQKAGGDLEGLEVFALAKLDKEMYEKLREVDDKGNPKHAPGSLTPSQSEADCDAVIKAGEKKFGDAQKALVNYANTMAAIQYTSGLISATKFYSMVNGWKNYIPTARVFDEDEPYSVDLTAADSLKQKTGSKRRVISPMEKLAANTEIFLRQAERNKVKLAVAQMVRFGGFGEVIAEAPKGDNRDNTVHFRENGQMKYLVTPDKSIVRALESIQTPADSNIILQGLKTAGVVMRGMYTMWNMDFAVGNPFRDMPDAFIHNKYGSRNPLIVIPAMVRASIDGLAQSVGLKTKSKDFQEFLAYGGTQSGFSYELTEGASNRVSDITAGTRMEELKKGFKPFWKRMWSDFIKVMEASENMTRYATYKTALDGLVKKHGGNATVQDKKLAALQARSASVDFARAGKSMRSVNKYLLFSNAAVQSLALWGEKIAKANTKEGRAELFTALWKTFLGGVVTAAAFSALNYSDDDRRKRYGQLQNWEKDNYWVFATDIGGQSIRIPKGMDVILRATSALTEEYAAYLAENKPADWSRISTLLRNGLPSLTTTIFTPMIETMVNYSLFKDAPIVPHGQQNEPAYKQYGKNTSWVAKDLGELINYSPRKIDHLIQGYGGSQATWLTGGGDGLPILRRFLFNPDKNPRIVQDYYKALEEQETLLKTYKAKRQDGEKVDLPEGYDRALHARLKAAQEPMRKISRMEMQITDSDKLSDDQKKEKLQKLERRRVDFCERVFKRAR